MKKNNHSNSSKVRNISIYVSPILTIRKILIFFFILSSLSTNIIARPYDNCSVKKIIPYSRTVSEAGGTTMFDVILSDPMCSPYFTGVPSWLSVRFSGVSEIIVTVRKNTGGARSAIIGVNAGNGTSPSKTFSVYQNAGVSYYLNVSPTSLNFQSSGGSNTFSINTNTSSQTISHSGCVSGVSRSGNTVTVSCASNNTTSSKTGSVTVSGGGITRTVSITQDPLPCTAPYPMNYSVCAGKSVSLTAVTSGSGITGHRWYTSSTGSTYLTSGVSVVSSSNPYVTEYTATFSSDMTYYVASICNGNESSRTPIKVIINPSSSIIIMPSGDPFSVCPDSGFTLTASGGSNYRWRLNSPSGTILSTSSVYSPTQSGTYYLTGTNDCNQTKTSSIPVTVIPNVGTPTIPSGTSSRCQGSGNNTYTTSANNATSYNWSLSPAAAGSISGTGTSASVSWSSSFYGAATVSVSANGCSGPSATRSKTVTVTPTVGTPTTPSGTSSRCQGSGNNTYTTSANNATSYNWSLSPAAAGSISGTGTSATVSWSSSFYGTATVSVSANGCSGPSATRSKTVTVNPDDLQAGTIVPALQQLVLGNTPQALSFTTDPSNCSGNYSRMWQQSPDGENFSDCGATGATFLVNVTQTTYFRVKVSSSFGVVYTNPVLIEIYGLLIPGEICCDTTITAGTQPGVLEGPSDLMGGKTPLQFQWEMTEDPISGWTPIQLATDAFYQPGPLEKTTFFRRTAYDDLGQQAISDSVIIQVADSIVTPPNSLLVKENNAIIHKGKAGLSGKWAWYDSYKGTPFMQTSDSVISLSNRNRSVRVRARAEYKVKTQSGSSIPIHSYFVSAKIQKNETLNADPSQNYIISYSPIRPTASENELNALPLEEQGAVVQYYDGLGRPTQTIAANQSFYFNDLVTGVGYDSFGRQDKAYIPSTSHRRGAPVPAIDANISDFYSGTQGNAVDGIIPHNGTTYTYTRYEASPLNRVEYVTDPEGGTTHYEYGTNAARAVTIWTVDIDNNLVDEGKYAAGELYRTKITDVSGKTTEEYKDKLGQVILKVAGDTVKTYYAYDDFGLLRYILSPKASDQMNEPSYTSASSIVKGLCYYYQYDHRQRMIIKQLPGSEAVYMVYDARDRLVLIQDGKTRDENGTKWLYTKYDDFNRPVETGWLTTTDDHEILQGNLGESVAFPPSCTFGDTLTQTIYDQYPKPTRCQLATRNDKIQGLETYNRVRLLDGSGYQETYTFYDNKYRVIQTDKVNPPGLIDMTVQNTYDFTGNIIQSREAYSGQVNQVIEKFYTYDHAGRLEKTEQLIEGDLDNGWVVLAEMDYNELGQLMLKKLHAANDTSFVQDIDYLYDVRGWLKQINNLQDTTYRKLYAQELDYFQNGNIQQLNWKNTLLDQNNQWIVPTNTLGYTFAYDAQNRMTTANYIEPGNDGHFNTSYTYDSNGNLSTLQRIGNINPAGMAPSYDLMDNLSYTYPKEAGNLEISNQLSSVSDNGVSAGHTLEYKTAAGTYLYDDNGNATVVPGKGTIAYNYLNQPKQVDIGSQQTIYYLYDAAGNKLKKNAGGIDSYYQGSVLNINGQPIILTGEGRAVYERKWNYEYDLKDHLGNTRVSFAVDTIRATPLQYKDYYPFGMEMARWYTVVGSPTKYLYNGKELQDEFDLDWYDYGARFYDPELGRWHTLDPKAEMGRRWSPYNYAWNNPMRFIDPDGMQPNDPQLKKRIEKLQRISNHAQNASNSASNIFNESGLKWSGSYLSIGGDIETPLLSAGAEAGVLTGDVALQNDEKVVEATGSFLFANAEINSKGDLIGAETELAAAKGSVSVNKNGEISTDGEIGVANQELTYPGKDGQVGIGFKISKIKVDLKANFNEVVNTINEFLGIFDELGAFGEKNIAVQEDERNN